MNIPTRHERYDSGDRREDIKCGIINLVLIIFAIWIGSIEHRTPNREIMEQDRHRMEYLNYRLSGEPYVIMNGKVCLYQVVNGAVIMQIVP